MCSYDRNYCISTELSSGLSEVGSSLGCSNGCGTSSDQTTGMESSSHEDGKPDRKRR